MKLFLGVVREGGMIIQNAFKIWELNLGSDLLSTITWETFLSRESETVPPKNLSSKARNSRDESLICVEGSPITSLLSK